MELTRKVCITEYVTEQSEWHEVGGHIQTIFNYARTNGFNATYNELMVSILLADDCKDDDLMVKAYQGDQGALDRLKAIDADGMPINKRLLAPLIDKDADFLAALIELEVNFKTVMEIFEYGE